MSTRRKPSGKTRWDLLALTTLLLAAMLLSACQSAAPASPTAAAPTAAPAAQTQPTAAPAAPAATAAPAPPATDAKTVTVKIGFQPAYTGAVAVNSEPQSQGIADYLQWINDQGGVAYKDPKTGATMKAKLDVVWEDNGYDTSRVVSIYNRQKATGVKGMITYGTVSAVALAEQVSKDKMPILVLGGPNDAILKPTPRYVTTVLNLYDMMGKSFVTWAKAQWKDSRAPRLGIVYTDAAFGQMGTAGLADFSQKLGWEVLKPEPIQEPLTDSSIQVKRLMEGKPDWVFNVVTAGALAVMMKDAARLGFKDQTKWVIYTASFDPPTFQKVADADTNGVDGWVYWATEWDKNLPGVIDANQAAQKYRKGPAQSLYIQGWGTGAVFVQGALKGALEKVGFDALTPEAVNTALHSVKGLDTGGIFPDVTISDDQPWVINKAHLLQWKDHQVTAVSDWVDGSLR